MAVVCSSIALSEVGGGAAPAAELRAFGRFGTASDLAMCNQIGGLKSDRGEDAAVKNLRCVGCALRSSEWTGIATGQ
jgi:hypothetical protein